MNSAEYGPEIELTNGTPYLIITVHFVSTVECCNDMVQYNMRLYTLLLWLRQSMNYSLNPQTISHTSL